MRYGDHVNLESIMWAQNPLNLWARVALEIIKLFVELQAVRFD
jgi:hypothetical protein